MHTIIENIKLLGMTVVFTLGQAVCFNVILPAWLLALRFQGGDG